MTRRRNIQEPITVEAMRRELGHLRAANDAIHNFCLSELAPINAGYIDTEALNSTEALDFDIAEVLRDKDAELNAIMEVEQVGLLEHLYNHINEIATKPEYSRGDCLRLAAVIHSMQRLSIEKGYSISDIAAVMLDSMRHVLDKKPVVINEDFEL